MLHSCPWPIFADLSTRTGVPKNMWNFQDVLPSPMSIPFPGSQLNVFRESKMVPIVTWHPMLLSRRVWGPILNRSRLRKRPEKGMRAPQTQRWDSRKLVENHFPMSVHFYAKIYSLCELPRKVKALVLKQERFFPHDTCRSWKTWYPLCITEHQFPVRRHPSFCQCSTQWGQLFHFSPLAERALERPPGPSPRAKSSLAPSEDSLLTIPFI